jgi:hypothetical protein
MTAPAPTSVWCPNPFEHLTIIDNGDAHLCLCPWTRPAGNVLQRSPIDIWNGTEAQLARELSLQGDLTRVCPSCPHLPGPRGFLTSSPRPARVSLTPPRVEILKLDYDRTCRLACGTCRSQIASPDRATLTKIHEVVLHSGILRIANQIYASGAGDPFDSVPMTQLLVDLPRLTDPRSPPQVIIHTHGLTFEKKWQKLGPARDLVREVRVSFDLATPDDEMINRGGSWRRLADNLAFMGSLRPKISLRLYYVVQANNFAGMPLALGVAEQNHAVSIDFMPLENWGTYTPQEYIERAVHLPSHPRFPELLDVLRRVRGADAGRITTGTIFSALEKGDPHVSD